MSQGGGGGRECWEEGLDKWGLQIMKGHPCIRKVVMPCL